MYDHENVFAKILKGEIPAKKIYETEYSLAFEDINKKAKFHALIIPKGAYLNFQDFMAKASKEEIVDFFKSVEEVLKIFNDNGGFRLISNCGENGGQEVPHMHFHVLAGEPLGAMICK